MIHRRAATQGTHGILLPLLKLMSAIQAMPDSAVSIDGTPDLIDALCGLPRAEQRAIVDGIRAEWKRRGWN